MAKVEKDAFSSGVPIHEKPGKIFKLDEAGEGFDKDWSFGGTMTAENVKANKLRGIMWALREKCRSKIIEVSANMLAGIAIATRNLDLRQQVAKREQALHETKRKLQDTYKAAFLTLHSASKKVRKARMHREKLKDAKMHFVVAQVDANKARNDAKLEK